MRYIPVITKNLLIINVLCFLASWVFEMRGFKLTDWGGLHFFLAKDFHYYQFLTYLFLHGSFQHLFFNMFALWMFGCVIEQTWGARKFLFFYLSCGVGAGLLQEIAQFVSFYIEVTSFDPEAGPMTVLLAGRELAEQLNGWTTIGASGAVYGVLLAFGMLFPEQRMFIFPLPIPIKAKWFITFYVVLELFMAVGSAGDGVAHTAHLGGMLFAYIMIRYWRHHPSSCDHRGTGNFFDRMKKNYEHMKGQNGTKMTVERNEEVKETDWEYNTRKKEEQEEIDRILDKIRCSGYDSLTKEEKRKLFDNSNHA